VITSKEVFAKRKEGAVDEAYRMALELMGASQVDDWDKKAFCWCLIDLIKRDAKNGNQVSLPHYRMQLESIELDPSDDVLSKGIRNALSLCNPGGQQISQAKALSREGRHAESVGLYRKALSDGFADRDAQTGYGWELYHHSKELMATEIHNIGAIKRNLNDYLKLDVERPSDLHSRILQLTAKLAGQDKFSMLVFSRLWNLEYLRSEDFERYRAADGKEYPSLAERVIQQAGKEAAASDATQEQNYILPHIDAAIERFPDNIWLKLDKAKVLLSLGLHDEALAFALQVAKAKSNDYWAWGLLGDIVSRTDQEAALGCYCKALSCPADDKFTGKIRVKVAQRMLERHDLAAAKREIETVVRSKENEGYKIPEEAAAIVSQAWFAETQTAASNRNFYQAHVPTAEALLFSELPWIEANVGEKYTVPGKEDKPKRKILLKTSSVPLEVSIPESKIGRKKLSPGDAVRVKGEFDDNHRFRIFVLEHRDSEFSWDVLYEAIGVVDHVNHEKCLLHFIIDREIDGVISLSDLSYTLVEGDAIAVMLSKYESKHGPAYRVHQARSTDKQPSVHIKKLFCEEVRVSNGMGFTESDIFITPPLVAQHRIEDGQKISGTSLLSYNKKRACWGWKAISIQM
jgi:tetratricopeptide (TPR) repeat protein